jgi:hypothetical protein
MKKYDKTLLPIAAARRNKLNLWANGTSAQASNNEVKKQKVA